MKYRIWGSPYHSSVELSYALSNLNVSHTITSGKKTVVVNKGKVQPLAVHVTPNLRDYREGAVNFIVASAAELSMTNYPLIGYRDDLVAAVKAALTKSHLSAIVPVIKEISHIDYVNQIAKPSLLNKIQTQIHRIQPYALRKQTQQLVLSYLKSNISETQIKRALSDNLKHEELLPLVLSASPLRAAAARLATEPVEKVAAETGFPTFELLYISKERK